MYSSDVDDRKKYKLFAASGIFIAFFLFVVTIMMYARTAFPVEQSLLRAIIFKTVQHQEPPTKYWGSVSKPYPTGAFWTNLVVRSGDGAIGLYPYGVKTTDTGVQVSYGYSRRVVTTTSIIDPFYVDLQIGATQGFLSRAVESYDNVSVTVEYKTTLNGKFRTHLVKGSPYITVVYEGATPIITSLGTTIASVDTSSSSGGGGSTVGSHYLVKLGNGQQWLVYCSEPSMSLAWKDNTLSSSTPLMHGFVRIAIVPNGQDSDKAYATLLRYVGTYPTGAAMTLAYPAPAISTVAFRFTTVGTGPLLMYALPHQTALLATSLLDSEESKSAQIFLSSIHCIKGKLTAVVGDVWKLQYHTPAVGWDYSITDTNKLSDKQREEITAQLMVDVKNIPPTAPDPYSFGKELSRMARLALIADHLEASDACQLALATMKTAFTPWLLGVNPNSLLYDRSYGGVVTVNGMGDPQADYGSGWYSDHHFHYGYLIYAAATLAHIDATYGQTHQTAIETLVRDICNPDATDPDFPLARHKDFFDGHSWASGLFQQANGKGQESSSEATNAYYGVYLYALATANTELAQFSLLMLHMEIQATQVYWHMSNDDIYGRVFSASRMVGNVGALDVTASTWFGTELEYVHGINIMPVTPVTALLFDVPYVTTQWPVLATRLPSSSSNPSSSTTPPPDTSLTSPQCSKNPQCVLVGMTGLCCPTADGSVLACCDGSVASVGSGGGDHGLSLMQDEWKSLLYTDHAVVNRDEAWGQIQSLQGFGSGGSKTNSLLWVASRSPTSVVDKPIIEVPVDDNIVVTPVVPRNSYNAVTMAALVAAVVVVLTVVGVVATVRMRTTTSYSRVQESTSA